VIRRDDLSNVQGDLSTIDNLVADHLIARRRRILAAKYVHAIGRLRRPVRIDDQQPPMTDPAADENAWVAGHLGSPPDGLDGAGAAAADVDEEVAVAG